MQYGNKISDEIDLADLFRVLWRRRLLILGCIVLGFAGSFLYASLAAERWKSVAYLNRPRVSHIYDYLEQRRTLARADDNHVVDRDALASSLFGEFIRQASAEENKRDFFRQHPYVSELLEGASADEREAINSAAQYLTIDVPEDGAFNPHYTLSFKAPTAEQAQRVLSDYIAYSNKRAVEIFDAEFRDALTSSILTRRTERDLIERQLQTQRSNWIEELSAALDTARAAGVTNYMEGRAIAGNVIVELTERQRLFMLGETYLAAELKTAQESPIVYPLRYHEIETQLAMLEPLLDYDAPDTQAYRYLLEPTLPLQRESPRRSLIVALGVVLGGMFGIFVALIHSMVGRPVDPAHDAESSQKPFHLAPTPAE